MTAARTRLLESGRWAVLLCLFAVPINKPLVNVSIFAALLCSLAGPGLQERFREALRQPVAIGAAVWFAVLGISAMRTGAWSALGSYKTLLYPLLAATLLETRQWRERGQFAFGLAATLVLLLSWCQFLGIVPQREIAQAMASYKHTVFKDYTTQGIEFLVLAAMAASFALQAPNIHRRRMLWFLAGAAFVNVMFLLQSRTSYLIAVPLLLYWLWRLSTRHSRRWRSIATGAVALLLIAGAALMSPRVQQRLEQAEQDVQLYSSKREATSMGIRLELWQRTMPIIASAPILGHGLGQWKTEYGTQIAGLTNYSGFVMGHPHQETLLILSEEGIIGLVMFAFLLVLLGRYIRRLEPPHRDFYACLLLIYVTAGLANCILTDFSHRHLFLMLLACIPFVPKSDAATLPQAST